MTPLNPDPPVRRAAGRLLIRRSRILRSSNRPALLSLPEGAVGVKRSELCSNAQPVASIEVSKRLEREGSVMCPYSFVSAHTVRVYA